MFLPPGIVPPVVQFMSPRLRISKQQSRSVPNYKKANWEGIKQDLISSRDKFIAKFESGTNMDTIEENWKQFKEAINWH
jgi:hypothetical protein